MRRSLAGASELLLPSEGSARERETILRAGRKYCRGVGTGALKVECIILGSRVKTPGSRVNTPQALSVFPTILFYVTR